ncbi:MAG TPA: phosphatase PAP2 family protein [Actinomycetota bacterium]|nr:phosphatase PAP2 family protein [Actinomycetota bacterium]
MLRNHRRTFLHAIALLGAMAAVFYAVGVHPPAAAPRTTVPSVGEIDRIVYEAMDDIRNIVVSGIARALNVLGGGWVTIPLRILVAGWLALRRRWRAFAVWILTWATAESLLEAAKGFFHRGRPDLPLVDTVGFSFPSGHAVAGASIAVALVLVLLPAGPERRRWEWLAVAFAFVMAFSRVYLRAHWLSDVVAGVLLGSGVALGVAATVTEIRHHVLGRWWPTPEPTPEPEPERG